MNIWLITTGQQRADPLGGAGSPLGATPRLDALAAQGTRYSTARTQNPLCQPARASILTGTYPSTHGVTCNGIDLPADAEDRSVATLLSRAGYRTAFIGKAHFATTFPFFPTGRLESVDGSARVDPEWQGPFCGGLSFPDPHHPMDPPAPWCDRYTPADTLEVLPDVHPDEFEGKPPIHQFLAQGMRGQTLEWANPGGATLTREELAKMTAG